VYDFSLAPDASGLQAGAASLLGSSWGWGMMKKHENDEEDLSSQQFLTALGERIRKYRVAAKLSQRQFAQVVGMNPTTIYLVEGGGPNIGAASLFKMSKVLGVPITAFFDDQSSGSQAAASAPAAHGAKTIQVTESSIPVFVKLASELQRACNALDGRRDALAKIIDDLQIIVEEHKKETQPPARKKLK
jgi:transcriptional regulator with XRE-family HTH domain